MGKISRKIVSNIKCYLVIEERTKRIKINNNKSKNIFIKTGMFMVCLHTKKGQDFDEVFCQKRFDI